MAKVFLSYSHKDQKFVEKLYRRLTKDGVECFFDKESITWGANRRVRNQNSIKLASYSDRTNTIRVHPALDKSYVPKYVIMGMVYHEMLHHHLGIEHHNGRTIAHTRRFRQLEARYRHYHRLQAWKEKNLNILLGR